MAYLIQIIENRQYEFWTTFSKVLSFVDNLVWESPVFVIKKKLENQKCPLWILSVEWSIVDLVTAKKSSLKKSPKFWH